MLNKYRNIDLELINIHPTIQIYNELFTGERKGLPKGIWQRDEDVILIIRYVLESKLGLSAEEIPKITRNEIKENKLWGALNRFKSIKKLLHFVYRDAYGVFDFHRVQKGYWSSIENIRARFEYFLDKNGIAFDDIPRSITCERLIGWGFSNPLKRHGDSPYRLVNRLYPGVFEPEQFRKVPQRYWMNFDLLRERFEEMLRIEGILPEEIPSKITQAMLRTYGFDGALSNHNQSPAQLVMALYPDKFTESDFTRTQGYWDDIRHVRRALELLVDEYALTPKELPKRLTKAIFMKHQLGGLLDQYQGSPMNIIEACYPNRYSVLDFNRVPNGYWDNSLNRVNALRSFCERHGIEKDSLYELSRAFFRKHYPRFVSVLDRYYESKCYLWIIEAFPEYHLRPTDFNLLVGRDSQVCDSKEELLVHNVLIEYFPAGNVMREGVRFVNEAFAERYIPDWIVEVGDRKIIIEYFGLYGSDLYPGYTERAERKRAFYKTLYEYEFVEIMPGDLRRLDSIFGKLISTSNVILEIGTPYLERTIAQRACFSIG